MGMPERDRSLDKARERWLKEARKEEQDVERQREALGDGGPEGRERQVLVFSSWFEGILQRNRDRFGDPFTKPPFS